MRMHVKLIAFLAFGLAFASKEYTTTLEKRSATEDDLKLFAQYAEAAYCSGLYDGKSDPRDAANLVCTDAKKVPCQGFVNTTTIAEFTQSSDLQIAGYMAINPAKKHIVVAFKGTDVKHLVDIYLDVKYKSEPIKAIKGCENCKVHGGFLQAFNYLVGPAQLLRKVQDASVDREDFRLVVTGYSLGAGIATIVAPYLRANNIPCDLFTYGSPRVGNQEFVNAVQGGVGMTVRATAGRDAITTIPFERSDWRHTYPEYWSMTGNQVYSTCSQAQAQNNQCGSNQARVTILGFTVSGIADIRDHFKYVSTAFKPCQGNNRTPETSTIGSISKFILDFYRAALQQADAKPESLGRQSRGDTKLSLNNGAACVEISEEGLRKLPTCPKPPGQIQGFCEEECSQHYCYAYSYEQLSNGSCRCVYYNSAGQRQYSDTTGSCPRLASCASGQQLWFNREPNAKGCQCRQYKASGSYVIGASPQQCEL